MIRINHGVRDFPQVLAGGCRAGRRTPSTSAGSGQPARLRRPGRPGPGRSTSRNRRCAAIWITGTSKGRCGGRTAGPSSSATATALPALEERSASRSWRRSGRSPRRPCGTDPRRRRDPARRRHDDAGGGPAAGRPAVADRHQQPADRQPVRQPAARPTWSCSAATSTRKTGVALGPLTVRMMEDIHVHQTIMSVGGVTAKGLFNSNLLLVETERQMMRCRRRGGGRGRPYQDRPAGAGVSVRAGRRRHADRRRRLDARRSGDARTGATSG